MPARSAWRSFAVLALSAISGAALTTLAPAAALAVTPTAPVKLPRAIEGMAPYQPQSYCNPVAKTGTLALAHKLTATYAGTSIVSLTRPCGSDTSEHYDGRAIDWGVDHRNDRQRRQGQAFLHWVFAADSAGHSHAMFRRLGIMYIIWNKQIWGSWSQKWEPYSCSGVTACHVDHMHISLDWSGALKKTSFWTGTVTEPMSTPLLTLRSTSYGETIRVGSRLRTVSTPFRLLGGAKYHFTVSGVYHYDGKRAHRADAECSTANGTTWKPLAAGDTSATTGTLDLWVNNRRAWHPTAGTTCNTRNHTYTRTLSFASTTRLTMFVKDATHGDDTGPLTVTVRRVG